RRSPRTIPVTTEHCDVDAASRERGGASTGAGTMKTSAKHPWTNGHAFRNPKLLLGGSAPGARPSPQRAWSTEGDDGAWAHKCCRAPRRSYDLDLDVRARLVERNVVLPVVRLISKFAASKQIGETREKVQFCGCRSHCSGG